MPFKFNPTTSELDLVNAAGSSLLVDTKPLLIVQTPTSPTLAYATDTNEYLIWTGSAWRIASIPMALQLAMEDAGFSQASDKQGYGDDYIYDKRAYDFSLGDFTGTPFKGAFRVNSANNPVTLELYARGRWYKMLYDLNMDSLELQHAPVERSVQVWSGNSIKTGMNGQPLVQEYQVDAGAYPYPTTIDGGEL